MQFILAQSAALALTNEQRRKLEIIDLDLRIETARLLADRRVVELEAQRDKSAANAGLTPEQLRAIDEITVKLRQTWLRAQQQARAILSAEQLAKLNTNDALLPSFETDKDSTSSDNIDTRITEALASRLKDAKVVEIETTQAIAERLFSWTKSFAILAGICLTVLILSLGIVGVSNWADFQNRIADAKKDLGAHLQTATETAKQFDNQANDIEKHYADLKQKFGEFSTLAADVQELGSHYADLKQKFGEVSTLAADVQELGSKVQQLEKIQFERSPSLSSETQDIIEDHIKKFRNYLQSIGYNPPSASFKFRINPDVAYNASYDNERKEMVFGPKLVNMPDAIYRVYTWRVLQAANPKYVSNGDWKLRSLGSGLADYFPCSYLGNPRFGEQFLKEFPEISGAIKNQGSLRNLDNNRLFVADSAGHNEKEQNSAGEVWGGALWDVRTILSCKADIPKCERADQIILGSWTAIDLANANPSLRFVETLIKKIRDAAGTDPAGKARAMFERRGLQLKP
jgi:hypothetical protein